MSYRYATVVQLTMDDPANDVDAGTIRLVPGKHEDGWSYTVIDEDAEGFLDVECETIRVIGPSEHHMDRRGVLEWASNQPEAKRAAAGAS